LGAGAIKDAINMNTGRISFAKPVFACSIVPGCDTDFLTHPDSPLQTADYTDRYPLFP